MKRIEPRFLIDLDRRTAVCRVCKKTCYVMDLAKYVAHICVNVDCRNTHELRAYPDGRWETSTLGEIWSQENVRNLMTSLYFKPNALDDV